MEAAQKQVDEAWDEAEKRKAEHQQLETKLDEAREHRKSLEGKVVPNDKPKKPVSIDPAQPIWDNLVQQMVVALEQETSLASTTIQQQVQVKQSIINAVTQAQAAAQQVHDSNVAANNLEAASAYFAEDEDMDNISDASEVKDSEETLAKQRERREARASMAKANRKEREVARVAAKVAAKSRSTDAKDTIKPHLRQRRAAAAAGGDDDSESGTNKEQL